MCLFGGWRQIASQNLNTNDRLAQHRIVRHRSTQLLEFADTAAASTSTGDSSAYNDFQSSP